MKFATALYERINLEGNDFKFMTLKECIEEVEESFIDELSKRILEN